MEKLQSAIRWVCRLAGFYHLLPRQVIRKQSHVDERALGCSGSPQGARGHAKRDGMMAYHITSHHITTRIYIYAQHVLCIIYTEQQQVTGKELEASETTSFNRRCRCWRANASADIIESQDQGQGQGKCANDTQDLSGNVCAFCFIQFWWIHGSVPCTTCRHQYHMSLLLKL